MNKRENLLSLFRRKGYEYMPPQFDLCPSLINDLQPIIKGQDYEDYFDFPFRIIKEPLPQFDDKIYRGFFTEEQLKDTTIDYRGVGNQKGSENAKHMTKLVYPLNGIEDFDRIKEFPFQDFSILDQECLNKQVADLKARGLAAGGRLEQTVWEKAWAIRGMDDLMVDLMMENEIGEYILDKVYEQSLVRAKRLAKSGIDFIRLGDDVGMQHSVMMSKDMYCTFLKPRLAGIIKAIKEINPECIIVYHTCGYVMPFIDEFIDAGVEVLNPIQTECMDFKDVFAEYKGRISFWGTIGTQTVMPYGTEQEVKDMVKRNLDIAGDFGGLYCTPTHLLEPEVPVKNILAYVEAVKEYR